MVTFLLRLSVIVFFGVLFSLIVGFSFNNPNLAVLAFFLWAVLNKGILEKEEESDAAD